MIMIMITTKNSVLQICVALFKSQKHCEVLHNFSGVNYELLLRANESMDVTRRVNFLGARKVV